MLSITSVQVAENQRLNFLPQHFGKWYLMAEQGVYKVLRQFCESYQGAYGTFTS
ncbi:hypothetical protein ACQUW5_14520 [Legionella sp. CNM-1927-20]|uniref:hypothetical protein n=1 Tax=Legionella sp. CNM-1927-20 TaxID=3422221 RepID=UPI00403AA84E